jgi:hypothetical protein
MRGCILLDLLSIALERPLFLVKHIRHFGVIHRECGARREDRRHVRSSPQLRTTWMQYSTSKPSLINISIIPIRDYE